MTEPQSSCCLVAARLGGIKCPICLKAVTPTPIAELVRLVKCSDDQELVRLAARALHSRGVSIVGIIPTTPRKATRPILAHFDSIPSGY